MKSKICNAPCDKTKPHQIWDDKIFTERDIVIQCGMDHMKMCSDILLHIGEPCKVYNEIGKNPKMFVFFK